jgi:hypothetical protein
VSAARWLHTRGCVSVNNYTGKGDNWGAWFWQIDATPEREQHFNVEVTGRTVGQVLRRLRRAARKAGVR